MLFLLFSCSPVDLVVYLVDLGSEDDLTVELM